MGFEALLGNERLKDNLTGALAKGRVSHFYLISGPTGAGKKTLARLLAAAAMCTGREKPCLQCSHCRKVMAGTHPDFITVDDPEKRYVPIDLVRAATADMYVQPNEADRKIYLFPRAQDMQVPSQNALLKILEEPPAYGVFILLTDNAQMMLPTIRSRCTELAMSGLPEAVLKDQLHRAYPQATPEQLSGAVSRSGGYLGQAKALMEESEDASKTTLEFLRCYREKNAMGMTQLLLPMEKWKRDALIPELERWLQALSNALTCRSGMAPIQPMAQDISAARPAADLIQAINALQKALTYAQSNVSCGAICGYLTWALR